MAAIRDLVRKDGKPARRAPRREPKTDPGIQQLLAQRIREFHPNTEITGRCLVMMAFRDRQLTDSEKITLLEMCNCYSPESRRLALLNYIGYVRKRNSADMDLRDTLRRFRESPSNLIPVFSNEYIVENTNDMRQAIATSTKKPERRRDGDDEL